MKRRRAPKSLGTQRRRYIGSWCLPSGNSCDAYLRPDLQLVCEWDVPPSPAWPAADVAYWEHTTFPAILRAVAEATGRRVMGVSL